MTQGGIQILHVDDEPQFTDLTRRFLEDEDDRFSVETATSAEDALEMVGDRPPDCVVSDYNMPRTDGLEFLQAVRSQYPELPFILFTGRGSEAVASDAISAGVTDYLQKGSGTEQYELLTNRIRRAVDQYHTKRELERKNDLFAKAQNIASIGAWAHDVDSGQLRWTDQVYEIHGVSREFDPSIEAVTGLYHPEDRSKLREAVHRAVTAGEPYDLRVRMTARDDGVRWIRTVADPQVEDGTVVRVRGTVHDITDRVEREQELRQYEYFVEHSPDQILLIDEAFTVQYQSPPSSLHELDAIPVEGEEPTEYIHPEDQQTLSDHLEKLLANPGETISVELRAEDSSGEWRWVEARSVNLLERDPVNGILVMIRDVTQRKRRRLELERQNEHLEEFASIVSHDLRNPLNVAESHLELAQDTCENTHLARAVDALGRSQALVDDLLTLARERRETIDVESVALADVVRQSWQTTETGSATLDIDTEQTIQADRSRLERLLENLYRNSVVHGGDDVTVRVGTMTDGFYVADSGSGIPETEREAVFEAGHTTREAGTGFGLRLVEQIAEAHGWEVAVTESQQGGARFEITGVECADR